ncbi:hypothetical protein BE08_21235 [Sorangium cellulosum]|uniref:Uncharacterized protein n=1 Tax=Sorangium cellulosum TaxID=56 RepID=A0A150P106_SORCE|nr:hypothetical protein BE08_21235 [Sorangium cellulosum]
MIGWEAPGRRSMRLSVVRAPALPPATGSIEGAGRLGSYSAYLTGHQDPRLAMPRCIVSGGREGFGRGQGRPARGRGLGYQSTLGVRAALGAQAFIARSLSSKAAQPFVAVQ